MKMHVLLTATSVLAGVGTPAFAQDHSDHASHRESAATECEKEAERQRIEAEGKAAANRILSQSLTDKVLKDKGIEATLRLAESPNSKVIVVGGGGEGLPLILGNN